MDEGMSPDLLSDLPLDIIHKILSFIPIKDAIGTSFLSTQWRYLWTTLPNLDFDEKCVDTLMEEESDIRRLIQFIRKSLLLHKGPIHKFKVCLPLIISRRQFQFGQTDPWIDVYSSLYSYQNLTHLKLQVYRIPPPPQSFKGFLFLRSLIITAVKVDSSTIESIVAHSPLLEKFDLSSDHDSEMTIHALNLKFFLFCCLSTHLSLCTPLLEEFVGYFGKIKHLSFHDSLVFHHLRIIELSDVPLHRREARTAVDCLLTRSPNLQKLRISTLPSLECGAPELACVSLWNTVSAPSFIYDSLKVIEIRFSWCRINEMNLIKFLLARSPVLERIIHEPSCFLSEQEFQNLTAELLSCRRASAKAEIVIDKSLVHVLSSLRV